MNKKLCPQLLKKLDDSILLFDNLKSSEEVASFLEIKNEYMLYLLYKSTKLKYKEFQIKKKSGGYRIIQKPMKNIAILQKKNSTFP